MISSNASVSVRQPRLPSPPLTDTNLNGIDQPGQNAASSFRENAIANFDVPGSWSGKTRLYHSNKGTFLGKGAFAKGEMVMGEIVMGEMVMGEMVIGEMMMGEMIIGEMR